MPNYSSNYSKWDTLELSDDSDIEGHPNVDHKSLVRWKQRDIHQKREERKIKIATLQNTIKLDNVLIPRLESTLADFKDKDASYYSSLIDRLRKNPSPEKLEGVPDAPTYDSMVLGLLEMSFKEVVEGGTPKNDPEIVGKLATRFKAFIEQHKGQAQKTKVELDVELKEQAKHITSDDLKEGFDSKYVPPKPEPVPEPARKPKQTKKSTQTTIETLNPATSEASSSKAPEKPAVEEAEDSDEDDDEEPLAGMTESLTRFSKIRTGDFEASFAFIQKDKSVLVDGGDEALLLQSFRSASKGQRVYARQCAHQSLILQYCMQLGRDGIGAFFKSMLSGNKKAIDTFNNDLNERFARILSHADDEIKERKKIQEQGGVEQIQLVTENENVKISFDVPDGPPPADLRFEDETLTQDDQLEIRRMLQARWEIYETFEPAMKKALSSNNLEKVNKVLGRMKVEDAEELVEKLQQANIMSFGEEGIRDETGIDRSGSA